MGKSPILVNKRSCDACHQRKIQCDGATSQCDWCRYHGLVCTFNRPFGRRKRPRKIDHTNRVDQAQTASKSTTNSGSVRRSLITDDDIFSTSSPLDEHNFHRKSDQMRVNHPTTASSIVSRAVQRGFYFDGIHLGAISSGNGIPVFSEDGYKWIYARTGSVPATREPSAAGLPWQQQNPGREASDRIDDAWELPDRSMVKAYFALFKRSSKNYVFPIIDEASFMDTIDRAYDTHSVSETSDVVRAKACVLSFTSILVHMEGKLDSHQSVDGEQCAARVQRLMPHILMEANRESLQVCAMQCMYHIFSGNAEAAATFLSIACRFALMLGAHLEPVDDGLTTSGAEDSLYTRRYLRRLFWLCYMFDKDICLRAGYPPVIDDDHCDLTLPQGYKEIDEFDSFKDGSDLIPGDMRLTIIKSKVIRSLYCATAFRKSDAELLRNIRELDDELERWRMLLPAQHRPNLASSYRIHLDSASNKAKKVHLIVINLEYYFLLALIHSASGRCRSWVCNETDQRSNITSSQALALQASRSTLLNLHEVSHVLNCGDFWFFVLYPISAGLTLFCNILLSPLNSQAERDLQLLQKAPGLIAGMRTRQLSPQENARVSQVEGFIAQLTRFAECAIKNVRRGDN